MFPEAELFQYVLLDLGDAQIAHVAPIPKPLPCDRYVARSCLQKTIRRGEVGLALRALARMLADHPQSIWRHLITIAIEDVGVADIDLVARVVAASRDRSWRNRAGGEWTVASLLVQQMAEADHCQAVCDLMLVGLYRKGLDQDRAAALEMSANELATVLIDTTKPIISRGIAALALGGCLATGQQCTDPHAVFDLMAEQGYFSHVVATCRAAWRSTRDPMALMLPIIWQARTAIDRPQTVDDEMPPVAMLGEIPDYALDQHTRAGKQVAQALVKGDPALRAMMEKGEIPAIKQGRTVGNLLFMIDGSPVVRRIHWPVGDNLRSPHRTMPEAEQLNNGVGTALSYLRCKSRVIAGLRSAVYM